MTTGGWEDGLLLWGPAAVAAVLLAAAAAWPGWRRLAHQEARPRDRLHAWLLAEAIAFLLLVALFLVWRMWPGPPTHLTTP